MIGASREASDSVSRGERGSRSKQPVGGRAGGQRAATRAPATPTGGLVAGAVEHFLSRAQALDGNPCMMVDGHCNVLWQTSGSERLLQPPLPLWISGGKVHASGASGTSTWPSFIGNLGERSERLLLVGNDPSTWILVRGWADRFGDQRLVFLKCALSWPLRDVADCGLAEDFGLTRSECAVLDEFARLAKPSEIAERLSVSLSTVRSHLKQIHAKLSVTSSVQLLRITRAYTDA
jgi:DNA-binding CsgD family transcriptional regulator